MKARLAALGLALPAFLCGAILEIPETGVKELAPSAAALSRPLASGQAAILPLKVAAPRAAGGAWTAEGLQAALGSADPIQLGGSEPQGGFLRRSGACRILLIENKSSVNPMSKKLPAWNWAFQAADFEEIEKAPKVWLDASAWDIAVFSSPGWWDNFSNPPSGPSRMSESVAEAARAFVKNGGTALFIDLAQWDLEKCWPKTLRLGNLGPWQLDKFSALGAGAQGKLSLAPEGVAAEKIFAKAFAPLIWQDSFRFPDGNLAPAYAAYALPDPGKGRGIVAGFAFHVFDQDDSLAGRAGRIFMNLLLASGASRVTASGDAPATEATAVPEAASPTPPPPMPTPSSTPLPTLAPTLPPEPAPTPVPTAIPSPVPTSAPTLAPTQLPTALPSPIQTLVPSPVPTQAPAKVPTPVPTVPMIPTALPSLAPSPTVQAVPRPLPTRIPTQAPSPRPSPRPTEAPRPPRPLSPAPTLVPVKVRDAIGCIQSSPEPFGEGGVYVFYCLKHAATVTFKVFNQKGKLMYSGEPKFKLPGSHQEFYGGVDLKGHPLKPGRYPYHLEAAYDDHSSEWRQSEFNLKHKKR